MGSRRSCPVRSGVVALAAALMLLVAAVPAGAHVTVNPDDAVAGSWTKLTFRVPNESPTASTVALTVQLPTDHPFASVSVLQQPGWTAETDTVTLDPPVEQGHFTLDEAVAAVTWTADDDIGIAPGEFIEFALSVGPVPATDRMVFPSDQLYSDGTVVSWDEVATGDEHPDHPAPLLTITDGTDAAGATDADTGSGWVAPTALVVAMVAVLLSLGALLRPRHSGRVDSSAP